MINIARVDKMWTSFIKCRNPIVPHRRLQLIFHNCNDWLAHRALTCGAITYCLSDVRLLPARNS
jgi:hypothetical protein